MANPIAGWYPDPSGDQTKLRWWDGNQWTDNYADAVVPQQPMQPQQAQQVAQPQQPVQPVAQPQQDPQQQETAQVQSSAQQATPQPQPQPQAQAGTQPQAAPQPQQPYNQAQYGAQPQYGQAPGQQPMGYAPQAPANSTDDTLRLIAFILCVISTVALCWAIIPLAWMIPMTVHCWGIYKRKKENTTVFGVCTLIFVNLIGGILLLVSTRDR